MALNFFSDPYVYAISHPRFRAALEKKMPWIGIKENMKEDNKSTNTAATES